MPSIDRIAGSPPVDDAPKHWTDQLHPASFRGAEFQVDTIDWVAGDNVVVREYPFQDLPTVFTMGAGAQTLRFSAYVIGDDYHLQREALMRRLQEGPGLLVHPTAGAMRVAVAGKYTVREAPTAEGGMARFDLHFVRADAQRYPVPVANPGGQVDRAAADVRSTAQDAYAARIEAAQSKPGWVSEKVVSRISGGVAGAWDKIRGAAKAVADFNTAVIGAFNDVQSAVDGALQAPRQLAAGVSTLLAIPVEMPQAMARSLRDAFAWTAAFSLTQREAANEALIMPAVGAGLVMYGSGIDSSAPDTPARELLGRLLDASEAMIEHMAIAAWAQAATQIELDDYDEARAMRAWLRAQMERMLQRASVDDAAGEAPAGSIYDALMALYTASMADLQMRSTDQARLTTYTPQAWEPIWLVSHRMFGVADYADEIMATNPHIEHPLLVPPGRPVRVVRHD